jgi:hypothetical protein
MARQVFVTGDYGKLGKWSAAFSRLGAPKHLYRLNLDLAHETKRLIDQGFAKRRAPNGKKWARRSRSNPGTHPILEKTGRLRKSWLVKSVNQHKFTVASMSKIAAYHQDGVRGGKIIRPKRASHLAFAVKGGMVFAKKVKQGRIPRRPMVPDGGRLPVKWRFKYAQKAAGAFLKALKGTQ